MEKVGAQVTNPIFIHQALGGGRFCETRPTAKKRNLPYEGSNHHHHQFNSGIENQTRDNWNPKLWDWDSVRFVAKPLESNSLGQGFETSLQSQQQQQQQQQQRKRDKENGGGRVHHHMVSQQKNQNDHHHHRCRHVDGDDDESLRLQLGAGAAAAVDDDEEKDGDEEEEEEEEPVSMASRPNKRVRSGSPGGSTSSSSYPMCQVDNCKEDLSKAKDYHRRHKVCEVHSKSSNAIVAKQMQRFCQQCSRFHPLSEFDEGKRSCRRRLAGHNRRRRKTQPDDVTSRPLLLPANYDQKQNASGNSDIVNLFAVLARAQGNNGDRSANCSSIQILSKINSLPLPADFPAKLLMSGANLNRNNPEGVPSDTQNRLEGGASSSSPSTMDLLAVLSAKLSTTSSSSAPDALSFLSQRSNQSSDAEKTNPSLLNQQDTDLKLMKGPGLEFPSVGAESSTSYQSPVEDSDCQVQETRVARPLQLFNSSPDDDSPLKQASTRNFFSSDSSNPMEERSPSASPPVAWKLFPMHTSGETAKSGNMSISRERNATVEVCKTRECITSLELFGRSKKGGAGNGSFQTFPYQTGYTSSSGSDHSPSSLHFDSQDRTGRIVFKLFDKDPSSLPGTLRTEIYNWLSHSPSEMESYIRPGCVVLSVYISMQPLAWEQLEENLPQRVFSLVKDSESVFWRNGRFLVHTGRQLVSHKDGKIRVCKSWRTWTPPELICISPLAVVSGQETSLLLRGRNLSTAGVKIHCTQIGGYISKEASVFACHGTLYNEISLDSFKIHGAASSILGRCFIEVDNGFKGTSFPVIVADASICEELRLLEHELGEGVKEHNTFIREHFDDDWRPRSREEVMHFLNELGWLFERRRISSTVEGPDYKLTRFKFLFLFSIERDYCALVKTLLDILVERYLGRDGLSTESLGMLSEIHLLNRAVKRKCRKMVDLLLHYSVHISIDTSNVYLFPPNLVGSGGVTPLHLAACTSSSDDMVDALISDPREIGLHCWSSLLDANGLSPYAYALMRTNYSYNELVTRKLADRRNSQLSVSIGNEIEEQWLTMDKDYDRPRPQFKQEGQRSCSKCAIVAARYNNRRIERSQGLLQRPYIHSMLVIATVCVCVCLFLRGAPDIGLVAPFKWENLGYGPI